MLSVLARRHKKPIITVSREYCLSDQLLLSQRSLTLSQNPSKRFEVDFNDFDVYICKDYDYL
jgi:translation initiation factor 2B subunit (eIF-2B alpha/beta/delta family)